MNRTKPTEFYVNDEGVYAKAEKERGKDVFICSPLYVTVHIDNEDATELRLEWVDLDDISRQWIIPRRWSIKYVKAIREELLSRDFPRLASGYKARKLFIEYLMSARPEKGATK